MWEQGQTPRMDPAAAAAVEARLADGSPADRRTIGGRLADDGSSFRCVIRSDDAENVEIEFHPSDSGGTQIVVTRSGEKLAECITDPHTGWIFARPVAGAGTADESKGR